MSVEVERFVTGPLEVNTYLVSTNGCAVLFDPSTGCGEVLGAIVKNNQVLEAIVLTHAHFDHITGLPEVLSKYPDVPVYCPEDDIPMLRDENMNGSPFVGMPFVFTGPVIALKEGPVEIGHFSFMVLNIPGHTPGGAALLIDDYCFCGDILFAGSIGRSDFPGGDGDALIKGIHKKLLTLDSSVTVCPGHGGRTTIGRERRVNPFLKE
jgi:hydroxyacylglutathione hydrolase